MPEMIDWKAIRYAHGHAELQVRVLMVVEDERLLGGVLGISGTSSLKRKGVVVECTGSHTER